MSLALPITMPWTYGANPVGPILTPLGNGLTVTLSSAITANNQVIFLSLPTVSVTNGWMLGFDLKFDQIAPATEVKFSLSTGVILRFNAVLLKFQYQHFDNGLILIGDSGIIINDQIYHHVVLNLQPAGVQIVEDGVVKGFWNTSTAGPFPVEMDWQILAAGAALQVEVKDVVVRRLADLN
ncbi:hypothetical protein C8J57DRAFT_1468126 [Mycena rebaudengoi]|nr:hypothetical protein C8J57DRAFT_1468126 [Mycena rebaudengoi]